MSISERCVLSQMDDFGPKSTPWFAQTFFITVLNSETLPIKFIFFLPLHLQMSDLHCYLKASLVYSGLFRISLGDFSTTYPSKFICLLLGGPKLIQLPKALLNPHNLSHSLMALILDLNMI